MAREEKRREPRAEFRQSSEYSRLGAQYLGSVNGSHRNENRKEADHEGCSDDHVLQARNVDRIGIGYFFAHENISD